MNLLGDTRIRIGKLADIYSWVDLTGSTLQREDQESMSVLVPRLDASSTIEACLGSKLDSGSSDNTLGLAKELPGQTKNNRIPLVPAKSSARCKERECYVKVQ